MQSDHKSRITLQFYEDDFRQREVLNLLRKRPRGMTEFVVNAITHYVRCPNAENDGLSREFVKGIVRDVMKEMQENGELEQVPGSKGKSTETTADLSELGDVMGIFRGR
jgi:hypothetical protein